MRGLIEFVVFFIVIIGAAAINEVSKKGITMSGGRRRNYSRSDGKSQDVVEIEKKNALLKAMGSGALLSPEELAAEETYTSTYAENAYIQNNNKSITHQVCVLTPSFDSDKFVEFAKDIFEKYVNLRENANLGSLVGKNIDTSQLPEKIVRYDVCFMHNYIVEEKRESIKLLFNVQENDSRSSRDAKRYFVTLARENQLLSLTKGEVIAVSCPNCGGNLNFGGRVVLNCPYCNNTVTFAEYDWVMESVERVVPETVVTNRAVITKK